MEKCTSTPNGISSFATLDQALRTMYATFMTTQEILISGAGIAGAAAAYWLREAGFTVTVVERAPTPRPAGRLLIFAVPAAPWWNGWACWTRSAP